MTDREGVSLHATIHRASPHHVTLLEQLTTTTPLGLPRQKQLIYDKAADSNPLPGRLKRLGIRLIGPFIKRRNKPPRQLTQRDRSHYRNRWKIDRTFSWSNQLRYLTTREEYHSHLHLGFWQLGCLITILTTFLNWF